MSNITVTLPEEDFDEAIADIMYAHGEFCVSTDNCNCNERANRMAKAVERAIRERSDGQSTGTTVQSEVQEASEVSGRDMDSGDSQRDT